VKLDVLKQNQHLSEVAVDTSDDTELYEIFVGRSEDCHVRIDDPLISRHHLVIRREGDGWVCQRLSQMGIVSINGGIISKSPIRDGDEVKFVQYSIFISGLGRGEAKSTAPVEKAVSQTISTQFPSNDDLDEPRMPQPVLLEKTDIIPEETENVDFANDPLQEELAAESSHETEDTSAVEGNDSPTESFTEDFPQELAHDNEFSSAIPGENYEMTESDSGSSESTQFFKAFVSYNLILFGEHAPYDRFQIDRDEVFIGRDAKKCQIILNDPEVSSVHAVVRKNNTEVILEDLNSSNGTILNGERINKAEISAGDEFVIGSTSFTLEVKSDLLESESDRLMPVASDQVVETEEVVEEEVGGDGEISFDQDAPPEKSIIKRIMKDPVKRKKAIYAAAVFAIIMLLLDDSEETEKKKPAPAKQAQSKPQEGPKLSKELQSMRDVAYELGVSYFEQNRLDMAQVEFQKVVGIDPKYKNVQSYLEQTNAGLKRLQEIEEQKRAQEEKIKLKKLVEELLVKAREAVKERQVKVAESYFSQIAEKDPENIEITQLRLELEEWQKEEERKALEKAAREAARKKMVDSLNPGKTFYLKKEWYRAILKLEEFLRAAGMDEDLVKEASDMLSDSKNQLASELGPLLGKARSLKEGQDFKSAYEAFLEILKVEPTNSEALNEVDDIKSQLDSRSRRIYREAIIAESLSLFADAKEKFLEVQQISPTDSEYYKKASEKLKNYLE
jgi:pSer/pThr/pTyr-binding forkhead associated (FHA) protein